MNKDFFKKSPIENLEAYYMMNGKEKTIELLNKMKKYCDSCIKAINEMPKPIKGIGDWIEKL